MVHRRLSRPWLLTAVTLVISPFQVASAAVVNVAQFGAMPNDRRDDSLALAAAAEACRKNPGARLVFSKGQYDFAEGQNPVSPQVSMSFQGCRDLKIDGNTVEPKQQGKGLQTVFMLGPGCDENSLKIQGNQGF